MRNLSLRIEKKRLSFSGEMLIMLILLLSFMDFQLYGLHLMVIAFFVFGFFKHRISIGNGFFPPLILTVVLVLFWARDMFSLSVWMKCIVWPLAFLLGYNILRIVYVDSGSISKIEEKAHAYFSVAAIGFFIHIVLNIFTNWGMDGIGRNTIDFWSGDNRAATGQAGMMSIPLAWCIAFIVGDNKPKEKLLTCFAAITMLYYNLTLGSRTIVVVFVVVFCSALILSISNKKNVRRKVRYIVLLVLIGILAVALFSVDVAGIRSLVEESTLGERLFSGDFSVVFQDTRMKIRWKYLEMAPNYLLGGSNIRRSVGQYAHDIFLDIYDEASIFAFLAVIAMLWDGATKLLRFIRCELIGVNTRLGVLCIYVVLFLEFCVEPIFTGMPWLLMTFCFFQGMVSCLYRNAMRSKCTDNRNM